MFLRPVASFLLMFFNTLHLVSTLQTPSGLSKLILRLLPNGTENFAVLYPLVPGHATSVNSSLFVSTILFPSSNTKYYTVASPKLRHFFQSPGLTTDLDQVPLLDYYESPVWFCSARLPAVLASFFLVFPQHRQLPTVHVSRGHSHRLTCHYRIIFGVVFVQSIHTHLGLIALLCRI